MKTLSIMVVGKPQDHDKVLLSEFDVEIVMEVIRNDENIKIATKDLTRCDLIVGLGNWTEDKLSSDLVNIARLLDIKVIHQTTFKNYVRELNDRPNK